MKITYIKLFNKNNEKVMMKHLREKENPREVNFNVKDIGASINKKISDYSTNYRKNNAERESTIVDKLKQILKKNDFSKKLVKKNQVVLVATALMLVTAGYLNYTNNIKMSALGDAQLVSTNVLSNEETNASKEQVDEVIETSVNNEESTLPEAEIAEEENNNDNELEEKDNSELNEKTDNKNNNLMQTSAKSNNSEYFTKTKLEREKMYSQMLETYQKIMENSNIPNDQKAIASNEIKNINSKKGAIATIENLMKVKGFEDVVVLVNDKSVNIVVKSSKNLETSQVAQIQNIISRELQSDIEDIHITTHE